MREPGRKVLSKPFRGDFEVNLIRQHSRAAQKTSFVIVVEKNHSDRSLSSLIDDETENRSEACLLSFTAE